MKKHLKVLVTLATVTLTPILADVPELEVEASQEQKSHIIEGASYYVHAQSTEFGQVFPETTFVTFYSPTGDVVKQLEGSYYEQFDQLNKMLDLKAQPQPTSCAIKYWPGIRMGFGLKKGTPGYVILFYDQHGNTIKLFRFNKQNNTIIVSYKPSHIVQCSSLSELKMQHTLALDLSKLSEIQGLADDALHPQSFFGSLFSCFGY